MKIFCPYCDAPAELVTGEAIYPHRPDLHHKRFYLCRPCDARVGVHPGTNNPLGPLANRELRNARQHTHRVFDRLWREAFDLPCYAGARAQTGEERRRAHKTITISARRRAYAWLADQLGIPREDCHIGHMTDLGMLRQVYALSRNATAQDIRDWWKTIGYEKYGKEAA